MGGPCSTYGGRVEAYRVLVGKPERKRLLGRTRLKILRRFFRKWDVGAWTQLIWLRIGTGGGHL
jgi:hypothetical protein